jgi:hypothetical protein
LPHFQIKLIGFLLVVLGVLNVTAHMLGRVQPPKAALMGFMTGCEDKTQPCWYGIVPGVTGVQEVLQIMAGTGEPDVARSIFSRDYTLLFTLPDSSVYCRLSLDFVADIVNQGQITPCPSVTVYIGDVAGALENAGQFVSLPPNKLVYGGFSVNVVGWPEPFTPIHYMRLLSPDTPIQHFPWFGFMMRGRYCQLVPSYPVCS